MTDSDQVFVKPYQGSSMDLSDAGLKNRFIISGFNAKIIKALLSLNVIIIAIWHLKNPLVVYRVLMILNDLRKRVHGLSGVSRYARSKGRFFWSENIPGWPSRAFNSHIVAEISRIIRKDESYPPMQTVIWAISNCCPLKCSHCCEWTNLADFEYLSKNDLLVILNKLIRQGLYHIQLSGGEPLTRFDDLIWLLNIPEKGIDFWILTSGYGLTHEKALLLKKAGLTGANISLDHWDENAHNEFRHNNRSFFWARKAAINCRRVGIMISLSVCATRSFISEENLWKYLQLAKEFGAGFIRIIEPRTTGNYTGKNVALTDEQKAILNNFYLRVNSYAAFRNFPIIMYPGYHQRLAGCFGAGDRYLYIDPKGDIHACPFCRGKAGNAVLEPLIPAIMNLRKSGCHEFERDSMIIS